MIIILNQRRTPIDGAGALNDTRITMEMYQSYAS